MTDKGCSHWVSTAECCWPPVQLVVLRMCELYYVTGHWEVMVFLLGGPRTSGPPRIWMCLISSAFTHLFWLCVYLNVMLACASLLSSSKFTNIEFMVCMYVNWCDCVIRDAEGSVWNQLLLRTECLGAFHWATLLRFQESDICWGQG